MKPYAGHTPGLCCCMVLSHLTVCAVTLSMCESLPQFSLIGVFSMANPCKTTAFRAIDKQKWCCRTSHCLQQQGRQLRHVTLCKLNHLSDL